MFVGLYNSSVFNPDGRDHRPKWSRQRFCSLDVGAVSRARRTGIQATLRLFCGDYRLQVLAFSALLVAIAVGGLGDLLGFTYRGLLDVCAIHVGSGAESQTDELVSPGDRSRMRRLKRDRRGS